MKTFTFGLLILVLAAVPAAAQVPAVVNPSGVEFTPSVDDGAPVNGVTRYLLDIATQAAPTVVVKSVDLGHPAIVAGKITVSIDATVKTLAVGDYVAVVKAEGPGGVSASVQSDPFAVRPRAPGAPGKPVWKQ